MSSSRHGVSWLKAGCRAARALSYTIVDVAIRLR
jgi:hypothetical protein